MKEQALDTNKEQIDNILERFEDTNRLESTIRELKRMLIARQRLALELDSG